MDWFALIIGAVIGYYTKVGLTKLDNYLKLRYTKKDANSEKT